jgi:hypothetical protein
MTQREPTPIRQLLDRLLTTRARRDREVRFSDAWRAADVELHQIERAIFRAPLMDASSLAATPADRRAWPAQ